MLPVALTVLLNVAAPVKVLVPVTDKFPDSESEDNDAVPEISTSEKYVFPINLDAPFTNKFLNIANQFAPFHIKKRGHYLTSLSSTTFVVVSIKDNIVISSKSILDSSGRLSMKVSKSIVAMSTSLSS